MEYRMQVLRELRLGLRWLNAFVTLQRVVLQCGEP